MKNLTIEDIERLFSSISEISYGESDKHFLYKIIAMMTLRKRGYEKFSFETMLGGLRPDLIAYKRIDKEIYLVWVECGKLHKPIKVITNVLEELKHLLSKNFILRYEILIVDGNSAEPAAKILKVNEALFKMIKDVYMTV